MVGKRIYYHSCYFTVTEWDRTQGKVAIDPPDADLADLLRRVMLANTPFVYYHNNDAYALLHPNLPPIQVAG